MNDGGSAFPRTGNFHEDQPGNFDNIPQEGMSLRDWFAGMALPALIAKIPIDKLVSAREADRACDAVVSGAYQTADAMLAERAKGADDETSA